MSPIGFPESTHSLSPSDHKYGDHIGKVSSLPVWSDDEQCVSCWKMSLRERISALVFGKVWLAILSGRTQYPASLTVTRQYFRPVTQGEPQC